MYKLFLAEGWQLINVEEMMGIETYHLATIVTVTDLGKNHQLRLNLVNKFRMRIQMFWHQKIYKNLTNYKGKIDGGEMW